MRRVTLLITSILLCLNIIHAQDNNLNVSTIYLENGLKVVMCENHSTPEVYGAVYVHAGSKNDPADATGMAHYFEHIMFKGTDRIGTTNWEAEKVYLDSIDMMYNKLHDTNDEADRATIQRKINELSIASAEYAIPNEVDVILTKLGSENLNAGTSYDMTVYYNSFPSNQIEKWMDVYVERFRNPVFRLFQSELETVYEEKNMYGDSPMNAFMEYALKEAAGEHPYGRPVIGLTEHLKNPQPTRMREFYNTYYVANNMTLLLVGDFDTDEITPMVKEKFSVWKSGEIPPQPEYQLPKYDSKIIKTVNMTPMKTGIIIFKGVSIDNEDNLALNMLPAIFSNGSSGIADKDMLDGKYMGALLFPLSLQDAGAIVLMYLPKLLFQSHEKAEEYVFKALDKLKNGDFSDDLFEATKTSILKERIKETETISSTYQLLLDLESQGKTYEDYLADTERIKNMTKDDIVAIANKYLNENYIDLRSKIGFPNKDKVSKPDWKPIEVKNTEAKSEFALMIENQIVPEVKPQTIDFGKDVQITKINDCFSMYSTKNPYNDIFNLKIQYNYGTLNDPELSRAITYFNMQGTDTKSFEDFELELAKLGAEININASNSTTSITIEGFESDLDKILALCEEKMTSPSNNESMIKIIVKTGQIENQTIYGDAATWAYAVYNAALYGDESEYLSKSPIKKWGKRSGEELLNEVKEAFKYNGTIEFVGNTDNQAVIDLLINHNIIDENANKSEKKFLVEKQYDDNQIFIAHSKKFRQSNIHMYVSGDKLDKEEEAICQVYNKYFGTDMYSIVFQEIRELRSLGYTAYGYFRTDYLNRKPGYLYTFLGTQSDKTNEGIVAMTDLIKDTPKRLEKFNAAKEALIMSRAADYINFREIPRNVIYWTEKGYDYDPRIETTNLIKNVNYNDVKDFYNRHIAGRPIIIMMSGNKSSIDMTELGKLGKITELKLSDIMK
ncbi:MAG: M16 family metallopeptidase [Candidatus Limimorpha sp.]